MDRARIGMGVIHRPPRAQSIAPLHGSSAFDVKDVQKICKEVVAFRVHPVYNGEDVIDAKRLGGGFSLMPFTARDLRYHPEETYPALHAYLARYAQHYLGSLKYDPVEPELVINHVIDQLIRLGLLGGGDRTPPCVLDQLSSAQFYSFYITVAKIKPSTACANADRPSAISAIWKCLTARKAKTIPSTKRLTRSGAFHSPRRKRSR